MGNNPFYDELLTLGQHLHERERLALYRFLIENKSDTYKSNALQLFKSKQLKSVIANGEITYSLKGDIVSYSTRKNGTLAYQENVRETKLNRIPKFRIRKLIKYFAQTEVEVIWNYPLEGRNPVIEGSYCTDSYPFFDLRYFSNGGSRLLGLINKLRVDDSDIRQKLKVS
ncbi:hypothetical protein MCEMZLE14_00058 [Candidatus Nanopelagicaceae bacterium]